jgi:hypothetical protein
MPTDASGAIAPILPKTVVDVLQRETNFAALSLIRRLQLPVHEREDLRQTLLEDVLVRVKAFDPARGSLGAFVGTIVRHQALRLGNRIRRNRANFKSVSLSDPAGTGGATIADTVTDETTANTIACIERRLDLDRVLGALDMAYLKICVGLVNHTPSELSNAGSRSRASIYRDIKETRLRLLVGGLSATA